MVRGRAVSLLSSTWSCTRPLIWHNCDGSVSRPFPFSFSTDSESFTHDRNSTGGTAVSRLHDMSSSVRRVQRPGWSGSVARRLLARLRVSRCRRSRILGSRRFMVQPLTWGIGTTRPIFKYSYGEKKWLQKHVLMLYQFAASRLMWWHRNCHQVKAKISVISVNLTLLYHSQSVSIWAIDEEDSQSVNHPTIPCATETVRVERLYLRGCSNSNKI